MGFATASCCARNYLKSGDSGVRFEPAKSARFSGSVPSDAAFLPLYWRTRFRLPKTVKKVDLGPEITRNRVNVGLKTLIPGAPRADL
jgi:hypothetical protein